MGAKKKGGKKKDAGKKAKLPEGELTVEQKNKMLGTQITTMKMRIVMEQEKEAKAIKNQYESKNTLVELDNNFEDERERALNITE